MQVLLRLQEDGFLLMAGPLVRGWPRDLDLNPDLLPPCSECAPTGSQCSERPTKGGFSGFRRRPLWAQNSSARSPNEAEERGHPAPPSRRRRSRGRKWHLPLGDEARPCPLSSMTTAVPVFTVLFFMSHVPPGSASFREVCERPNGSCQEFCLDSEIHSGRCLDGRPCCLPLVNVPEVEPTTPRVR
ncbi:beta-defensin 108B [Cervus elaphus]|uniref:beta-defensin 108B n=1 Tax=Cervus elaphus TaxID=9860 RepID=UPI001CC2F8EC|nr:beta-defensin 108B [Cervus elaphus]